MSGSTAPLYGYPHSTAPSYSTYAGASVGDSTYLGTSLSASSYHLGSGPHLASTSNGHPSHAGASTQAPGESTAGSSKRPFPWASGSGSQERDKRARSSEGSGFANSSSGPAEVEIDGEDGMSTDESAYASAAESPAFSRSPRADAPRSGALAPVQEHGSGPSFPAHGSTPNIFPDSGQAPRIPTPAALRSSSPLGILDIPPVSAPGPSHLPPPRRTSLSAQALAETRHDRVSQYDSGERSGVQESPRNTNLDLGWLTQQLNEALPPPRSLELFSSTPPLGSFARTPLQEPFSSSEPEPFRPNQPSHPARAFSGSFGSASVDSALALSAGRAQGRVPLPWVDIEQEGTSSELRSETGLTDFGDDSIGDALVVSGEQESTEQSAPSSPDSASIDAQPASPTLASHAESVASTVRSGRSPLATEWPNQSLDGRTPVGPASGPSRAPVTQQSFLPGAPGSPSPSTMLGFAPVQGATASTVAPTSTPPLATAPSTSGSPASARTTAARRPLSLNLHLRAFPTSPTLSLSSSPATSSMFAPLAGSPLAGSPTFPTSASPRTSTFDLAVTPPGSALPSFVARMMEVDSPVREGAGGDSTSHAYNLLGSPTESHSASIDPLGRFVENNEDEPRDNLDPSPIQPLHDVAAGSYFPESHPAPRQESLQLTLSSVLGSSPNERGSTSHPSEPSWPSRPSDLDSIYSRRLTESGVSFPSRPSDSGASLPSFRATVSPEPGARTASRPTRVVRDMSWSFSDLLRPHQDTAGTGSEASLQTRVEDGRASVRAALSRAVSLTRADPLVRDEQRPTNLSRTPPALGPQAAPLSETWFDESSSSIPTRSAQRRTSIPRWMELLPQAAMSAPRSRMSSLPGHDSGSNWNRNSYASSVPYIDSSLSTAQTPEDSVRDAEAALARYQTFAQSIEEIRRSPHADSNQQRHSVATSTAATTGTNSGRSSTTLGLEEPNARPAWALPRRELPQQLPSRNPYSNPYATIDNESERPASGSFEYRPADGHWLRQWEHYRDGRSRATREDYQRHQGNPPTTVTRDEPARRPQQQAPNDVWGEFDAGQRPRRPVTRASLVATGLSNDDLPEWANSNGDHMFPVRRAEIVPPRTDEAAGEDPGMGIPLTESPRSMLEGADFEFSSLPFARPDWTDIQSASHALRASLANPSRPDPMLLRDPSGQLARRSGAPPRDQPGLSASRDRWDPPAPRSYTQLERVRQLLLTRPSDPRDETSRRHIAEFGQSQPHRGSFSSGSPESSALPSDSAGSLRRSSVPWGRSEPTNAIDTHVRPFPSRESEHREWPSTEGPSQTNAVTNELARASSIRRRRRTLLPESASRRDSQGFLNSVNSALHQVESGLLRIDRELHALANDAPTLTAPARMDWTFDQVEPRPPSPPPRLPPFNFSGLQQNSDWPASHRNQHDPEPEPPRRAMHGYLEPRQHGLTYEYQWPNEGLTSEVWSNEGTGSSMPLRDRLLFRASAHPPPSRSNSIGSAFQAQPPAPTTFARLHRRRPSPPAPATSTSSTGLLRPFSSQANSTSPNSRSYASRFSHFLPRRSSGRGGTGSSDDNDDWHGHGHAPTDQSTTRRFFIRARGRAARGPAIPSGDFMRDEEFDDSYEGLLRLAARIGDAKPRGTPAEIIRSMPCCKYVDATGAEKETRCPICLDDYAREDTVSMIKQCGHWFHRECIQQWLSNARTCPVCRGQADGEGDSASEPRAGPSSSAGNSWV